MLKEHMFVINLGVLQLFTEKDAIHYLVIILQIVVN